MTPIPEIERAKARIRALAAKTVQNGCTDAEAFTAAEMIGRLLDRYMLTMDEVQLRASPCVQKAVPLAGKRRGSLDTCVPAIARFCHCIVWLEDGGGDASAGQSTKRYVYFGTEADVEMALHLHGIIARAMTGETANFRSRQAQLKAKQLRRALRSFQHGLAARLAERLDALHQAREAALCDPIGQGTALVLAKQATVAAAFAETKIQLRTHQSSATLLDRRAFATGQRAGDRINLRRPLEDGSSLLLQ